LHHQNNGLENISIFYLLLFNSGAIKSILGRKNIEGVFALPPPTSHLPSYAYDSHCYLEIIHHLVFSKKPFEYYIWFRHQI